ncbi:MAG TPA: methyltransferase [Sphingobacteriaceae bacterium]|nr:methyltransferase [Sphingobacteriaceae bacterium]
MKVNTDGVLLGALANSYSCGSILDIGTGTGVISLMLAQRYTDAIIDAVEIDLDAAQTAKNNFSNSRFHNRCTCYPLSFEQFFAQHPDKKYDLIVSNPPFFINSLKSAAKSKEIARHTTTHFFDNLLASGKASLKSNGSFCLILPVDIANTIIEKANTNNLYLNQKISIFSFETSSPHRRILIFGNEETQITNSNLVIYAAPKVYSEQYRLLLKDFLTIF